MFIDKTAIQKELYLVIVKISLDLFFRQLDLERLF